MRRSPLSPEQKELNGFSEQIYEEKRGVEKLLDFTGKIEEFIDSPEKLLSILQLPPEEILSILERINGLLLHKPIDTREAFAFNGVQTLNNSGDVEFTFPSNEERFKIFSEYSTLTSQLIKENKVPVDLLSMYVFNLIIYLHPFVDGNGRTARFSATVLQNMVEKNKFLAAKSIQKTVEEREWQDNEDFHYQMNNLAYRWLLRERGIEYLEPSSTVKLEDKETFPSLDTSQLFFVACYDVMSPGERSSYNRSEATNSFLFIENELPLELRNKAKIRLEQVRSEFIRKVLDISLSVYDKKVDENVIPDWLKDLFKKLLS